MLTSLDRYAFTLGPTRARDAHSFGNVLLTRHPIRDVMRVDLGVEHVDAVAAIDEPQARPMGRDDQRLDAGWERIAVEVRGKLSRFRDTAQARRS